MIRRSPFHRKTPLQRSTKPLKRTRLRPISAKRRRHLPIRKAFCDALKAAAGHVCQAQISGVCPYRGDVEVDPFFAAIDRQLEVHELERRSQGGSDIDPNNTIVCCRACHEYLHRNPEYAAAIGLILMRKYHGNGGMAA